MKVRIAVLADYDETFEPHPAMCLALAHTAVALDLSLEQWWVPTHQIGALPDDYLDETDGVVIGAGSPNRNVGGRVYADHEAVIASIRRVRESRVPLLATCGGYQHIALEYARHILGVRDATASYYDEEGTPIVEPLACSLRGMTLPLTIREGTLTHSVYGSTAAHERYFCRYGVTPEYQRRLHEAGLAISAVDANDGDARIVELRGHPFYVGTCFVPQVQSTQAAPHPLIKAFLTAVRSAVEARAVDPPQDGVNAGRSAALAS